MSAVAFDLEPIPNIDRIKDLPEVPVKPVAKNLKDPDKIAAAEEKNLLEQKAAQDEQVQKMGLDPLWGQIAVFAYADGTGHSDAFNLNDEGSEENLLKRAWAVLSEYNRYITFNGIQFDIPFLIKRSFLCRVRPTKSISTKMYYIDNHLDLRMILGNWDRMAKGKMDDYCKLVLGTGKTDGIDGSKVWEYWQQQRFEEVARYGKQDAEITYKLFEKMQGYYF